MQTSEITITQNEWTEIAHSQTVAFDIQSSDAVFVHLSTSQTPPAIDAPYFIVSSWPNGFDFMINSLPSSPRLWVRASKGEQRLTVLK